jgi:hypothetical protein
MTDSAPLSPALHDFERTYLEKLLLAARVLLDAAPDMDMIADPLEAELGIFKDRLEFALLLPEDSTETLPWRKLAGEISGHIAPEDE